MKLQELRKLNQGNTAEIFAYGDGKILKLFREGLPPTIAQEEYQIAESVSQTLEIVPTVYGTTTVENRNGIIYEEIQGESMFEALMKHPLSIGHYGRFLARAHIMVGDARDTSLLSVKEKLLRDMERVQDLTEEEKSQIQSYLDTLPDRSALCHFDFHPGNVLIRNKKPVIIDWMTACRGDSYADAARTVMILRFARIQDASFFTKGMIYLVKKLVLRSYIKEYLKLKGGETEDFEKWMLPVAAARLSEWIPQEERKSLLSYIRKQGNL